MTWGALGGVLVASLLLADTAAAHEKQLHLGLDASVSTTTFSEELAVGGYGGGLFVAYGLDDVFNLRAQFDLQIYELPEPLTSALVYAPTVGAEYVFDVMQWVFYAGLLAGPANVAIQTEADRWQAQAQIPFGLKYLLTGELDSPWALGLEGQYRVFLFGPEGSPVDTFAGLLRFEYIFSFGDVEDIPNPQVGQLRF